jgi:hypothetical protein
MKEILLGNSNLRAFVDDNDYPSISRYRWIVTKNGYAAASIGGRLMLMHRYILHAVNDQQTDHANHNRLDNQRSNIRICTVSENNRNMPRNRKNNKSGFKGVSLHSLSGKYEARIKFDSLKYQIGLFDDLETAAEAYDDAARILFGRFATFNFPGKVEKPNQ